MHSVTKSKDRKSEIELNKYEQVRPENRVWLYAQDLLDCLQTSYTVGKKSQLEHFINELRIILSSQVLEIKSESSHNIAANSYMSQLVLVSLDVGITFWNESNTVNLISAFFQYPLTCLILDTIQVVKMTNCKLYYYYKDA